MSDDGATSSIQWSSRDRHTSSSELVHSRVLHVGLTFILSVKRIAPWPDCRFLPPPGRSSQLQNAQFKFLWDQPPLTPSETLNPTLPAIKRGLNGNPNEKILGFWIRETHRTVGESKSSKSRWFSEGLISTFCPHDLLVLSREWMAMGVAGMILILVMKWIIPENSLR